MHESVIGCTHIDEPVGCSERMIRLFLEAAREERSRGICCAAECAKPARRVYQEQESQRRRTCWTAMNGCKIWLQNELWLFVGVWQSGVKGAFAPCKVRFGLSLDVAQQPLEAARVGGSMVRNSAIDPVARSRYGPGPEPHKPCQARREAWHDQLPDAPARGPVAGP